MKTRVTTFYFLALVLTPTFSMTASSENTGDSDPKVITQMRQFTFSGARAGEGYYSADGKKIVFQSEREAGNPFFQIYLMDIDGGKTERISTGSGKTTCSWIHPSGKKVLFSSTHGDKSFPEKVKQEYEQRKSAVKQKYSWSYDDNFEIYSRDLVSNKLTQLTHAKGYDAEASYSPDGKWIAFASNRSAYGPDLAKENLTDEDKKYFTHDQSYMMDIYIMKSDGSDVKRLTTERGYDGGPFFSPDGKQIVWRKFSPTGQTAEIMLMNTDGSNKRALTHMNSMSWAPFFHPSGDYIVFTTNILGFENFELYIVDSLGKHEPVRVSYIDGFDGLPVFHPNGKQISWTRRNQLGESQIYLGEWNDNRARELLGLGPAAPKLSDFNEKFSPTSIQTLVEYLADKNMAGRMTGSAEELKYANKMSELFQQMKLKPAVGKNYLQPFSFTSGVKLGNNNSLSIESKGKTLSYKVNEDFIPLSFSQSGKYPKSDVTFAGYGIVANETNGQKGYDSYGQLDVSKKWVLVFRDIPENIPNERRIFLNMYSRLYHKALVAKQRGALGLLVVSGPNSSSQQKIMKLRLDSAQNVESSIPIVSISDKVAEFIVKSSGRSLKELQTSLDDGKTNTSELKSVTLTAQVDVQPITSTGYNVLAMLKVPGASKTLVIGAHGDHLGLGDTGNSLATASERGQIHPGADDNASGVAGVMELAAYFSQNKDLKLKQNIIFAIWSGEEIGVLGSSHFLKNLPKNLSISANLNMDMIGRLRDKLYVQGAGSAKEWKPLLEQLAPSAPIALSVQDDPYLPTDSMSFYVANIPGLTFFTGSHSEYHSPRDVASLINYKGEAQILDLVANIATNLASNKTKLTFEKVEGEKHQRQGRTMRIYLGTIPDYTQQGVKGVRITGTSKDSPAEKAGLIAGDVIVELGGTKVENLYDYVYCLQAMKANQETQVKVLRQGKIADLKLTPTLRE